MASYVGSVGVFAAVAGGRTAGGEDLMDRREMIHQTANELLCVTDEAGGDDASA